MRKSLYVLPAVLLFGVSTTWAQLGGKESESESQKSQPSGARSPDQSKSSAKNAPAITTASAVASAQDDQKVQLRGKIVSKQKGNEYMFQDNTGNVLVEIGSTALKGSNKQLAAGTEVEIQGEVDTRKGKPAKVEAKQVTVLAAAGGASSSGRSSGSSDGSPPMRNQPPSGSSNPDRSSSSSGR